MAKEKTVSLQRVIDHSDQMWNKLALRLTLLDLNQDTPASTPTVIIDKDSVLDQTDGWGLSRVEIYDVNGNFVDFVVGRRIAVKDLDSKINHHVTVESIEHYDDQESPDNFIKHIVLVDAQ